MIKVTSEERIKFITDVLRQLDDCDSFDADEVAIRKIAEAWENDAVEAFERGVSTGWSER